MHSTTSDYWKVAAMQVSEKNRRDDSYIRSKGVEKSVVFLLVGIGAWYCPEKVDSGTVEMVG